MSKRKHDLNITHIFDPGAPMQRASQMPGFIPLKTGDPIPDELRAALKVGAFAQAIRELGMQQITDPKGES